jgi:hypothetical protein
MGVAIDFDRQPRLSAIEASQSTAGDKPPDGMLAADLEAELAIARPMPDLRLRRGEGMAKVVGALEDGRVDAVRLCGFRQ